MKVIETISIIITVTLLILAAPTLWEQITSDNEDSFDNHPAIHEARQQVIEDERRAQEE